MSYKGIKFRHTVLQELTDYAIGDCFCKYDMALAQRIKTAMVKYAAHVKKLSKAFQNAHKNDKLSSKQP